jgi:hypothetical protein
VGAVTIVLIVTLERTRIGALGMLVAVVIISVAVPVPGLDAAQLSDRPRVGTVSPVLAPPACSSPAQRCR